MLNVDKVFTTKWTTLDKVRDYVASLKETQPEITVDGVIDALNTAEAKTFVAPIAPFVDYQTNNGVIIPDMPSCMELAADVYRAALGNDIDTSTETHVGRMIEQTARIFVSSLGMIASNVMQYDITSATGAYLDAIASLFLIKRKTAQRSYCLVNLICDSSSSSSVYVANPDSTRFKDNDGIEFVLSAPQVFQAGAWSAVCKFVCSEEGSVVPNLMPSSGITWDLPNFLSDSSKNVSSYSVGYEVESDEDLRLRLDKARSCSNSFLESVTANLYSIEGVYDIAVIENTADTATPLATISGVPMNGHSICVIVDYDNTNVTELAIAKAIFSSKAVGCGYADNASIPQGMTKVSKEIVDEYFGNTHTVVFYRPDHVNFKVKVEVSRRKYAGADLEGDVKKAVLAWANGDVPYVDGLKIGQHVKAFEIGSAISDMIPEIQIDEVEVATDVPSPTWGNKVELYAYQLAVISGSDKISVEVV